MTRLIVAIWTRHSRCCGPRAALSLDAMNRAVSRLYAYENQAPGEDEGNDAAA